MTDSVIVCNGCCCGNTKKGHNAVPTDFLEKEWERQGLAENVKLTISDCLGPCSMHNVALLKTSEGRRGGDGPVSYTHLTLPTNREV